MKINKKLCFIANSSWYIQNFRLNLCKYLKNNGYEIYIICPSSNFDFSIYGFRQITFDFNRNSVNPFLGFYDFLRLYYKISSINPLLVFPSTIKINFFSCLSCFLLGIRVIPNVSGLGYLFINESSLTRLVNIVYKFTFRYTSHVFFQNIDDIDFFTSRQIIPYHKAVLLPGSGLDTSYFKPSFFKRNRNYKFTFLFLGRFLFDKGLQEYINAAKIVIKLYPRTDFIMLGSHDESNPANYPCHLLKSQTSDKFFKVINHQHDVRPFIEGCDCFVLPSYREGLSRALLEASSMAKPVITSDVPGCRDVVVDGETGLLCEARNHASLADAMCKILAMDSDEIENFGKKGRRFVKKNFEEAKLFGIYANLISFNQKNK